MLYTIEGGIADHGKIPGDNNWKEYENWHQINHDCHHVSLLLHLCMTTEKDYPFRELSFGLFVANKIPTKFGVVGKTTAYLHRSVDPKPYEQASGDERFNVILSWLEQSGKELSEKAGVSSIPFLTGARRLRRLGFTPTFILGPLRSSPNRQYKGTIEATIDPDQFSHNFIFFDKKGKVFKRIPCRTTQRKYVQYEFYTGTGRWRWQSDDEFVFCRWGGDLCRHVSLASGQVRENNPGHGVDMKENIGRSSFPIVKLWEGFWQHMGIE